MELHFLSEEPDKLLYKNTDYFCPLTFTTFEMNDDDEEENVCEYDGLVALEYKDKIKNLLEREQSYRGCDKYSMARYLGCPKVISCEWDVKEVNGILYGCIHILSSALTESEEEELKNSLEGQCSDGFGEGFEQKDIDIGDGVTAFVGFWNSRDDWFLKNEKEFYDGIKDVK